MDMYQFCIKHKNRKVRVHAHCGTYDGVIVDVDRDNLYLKTSRGELTLSAWYGPGYGYGYGSGILALSLFTLLAIALI